MESHRVALVTGSGKPRLGSFVAQALAEHGYSLAIHYLTSAQEAQETVASIQKLEVEVQAFQADLRKEAEVHSLVRKILALFGRIDVLVNCAGVWQGKQLEDMTAEDLRLHFEVNALGTFLCAQHVGLAMVRQATGGCIINLGDWAEVRPYLNYAAYFLSKGAVTALTRSLAVELGTRNPRVRVNCLLPGPVMLPADMPQEERQRVIQATLVKREGSPTHIAQAVLALIDNDFITGVCLPVDGGRTVYGPE